MTAVRKIQELGFDELLARNQAAVSHFFAATWCMPVFPTEGLAPNWLPPLVPALACDLDLFVRISRARFGGSGLRGFPNNVNRKRG